MRNKTNKMKISSTKSKARSRDTRKWLNERAMQNILVPLSDSKIAVTALISVFGI
jgi:hypothetical protein